MLKFHSNLSNLIIATIYFGFSLFVGNIPKKTFNKPLKYLTTSIKYELKEGINQ